ncbi:SoxR reducing system RseC family protein [Pseudomonas sp. GD03721]|jgi:sigma-E factor negative regulatory protein RseC|nr:MULTISPECIES: SoxR reducing system RseC family protein [Pseudomonas]WGL64009.1 SoxR reducing system RseC family protein [Pseudomonas sp. CW003PS]MDH1440878.1 SoxR reducing system RseC family protein [Pseudomonas sp. GD03722]TXR39790.1 transcriptional regulator [Pseudomonas mendocina]WGG00415.1 SoxR reducing system RseC family protein [Pseudomonas sp. GD03721]WGG04581.1 SoxR reducing system RseC family protein [Pseudomonas sp. GD03919]
MIEEQGRVVALESGAVWVETLRKSTCSSCSANAACGQGLMDRLGVGRQRGYVRALTQAQLAVGDTVIIGVREDLLVRSSILVYLLPLLGLFAAALLAEGLMLPESLVIVAGLSGLLLSWLLVRWRAARVAENPALQPVVLRTLLVPAPVVC